MEAQFESRKSCITCGSENFKALSSGSYSKDPLKTFMAEDPFGEDPLPYLQNATWTFVQCGACDQKFHQEILNDEWLGIYYSRWISSEAIEQLAQKKGSFGFQADFEKGKHSVERILLLEKLTRKLRGTDPVRILDFGCGEGDFLATGASFGFDGVGVEFSAAREKNKRVEFFPNIDDVREVYQSAHFHAVVLFEVLEHLAHPLPVLKELRTLVKDGGILILETPNGENVEDIQTEVDYRLINPLGHINAFTPATQERIAKEAGFSRISPGVAQCTADVQRVYKREARRVLEPILKRYTQQYFVAT